MKFLCFAWEEEQALNALSEAEWAVLRRETLDYVDTLRASGRLIDAQPLQSATTGSVVRVRNGRTAVTDGPFVETKEQIGGFFLLDVADHDEAVRIAAGWPSARIGSIEVRPLEDGLSTDSRYASGRMAKASA
mgnify:CR=1 FL=1